MSNDPEEIINTVGALAEMTATFYLTLLKNGINPSTAEVFTSVYIQSMIPRQSID